MGCNRRSDVPRRRALIKLTWAYKNKRSGKRKARLCVQGCSQRPGVDYDQTYSATLRPTSLRTLAAISARMGMRMRRNDAQAAEIVGMNKKVLDKVGETMDLDVTQFKAADLKAKIIRFHGTGSVTSFDAAKGLFEFNDLQEQDFQQPAAQP